MRKKYITFGMLVNFYSCADIMSTLVQSIIYIGEPFHSTNIYSISKVNRLSSVLVKEDTVETLTSALTTMWFITSVPEETTTSAA